MQIPGNLSKLKQRDHCKPLYHNCKQSCFTLVSFSKSSDLSSFVENKHKKKYRIAGFMYNLRTDLQPVSLKKLETDFFWDRFPYQCSESWRRSSFIIVIMCWTFFFKVIFPFNTEMHPFLLVDSVIDKDIRLEGLFK